MAALSIASNRVASRTLDIGDATIAVEVAGMGPAVVCVSGLDGRANFWRNQVTVISSRRRVVTFDQRGAGRSSHSRIYYSVSQMADDLLSILDALDIERATLLGHGLGSVVAVQLAIGHPERIEKMILAAPWAEPSVYLMEQVRLMRQILSLCGSEAYACHDFMRAAPASWLSSRPYLIRERIAERLDGLAATDIELSRLQAAPGRNLLAQLTNVRVRTLVVAAADDQVVPQAASRQLVAAMPHASFELLSNGGHFFPEVAADIFNDVLASFIDGTVTT